MKSKWKRLLEILKHAYNLLWELMALLTVILSIIRLIQNK